MGFQTSEMLRAAVGEASRRSPNAAAVFLGRAVVERFDLGLPVSLELSVRVAEILLPLCSDSKPKIRRFYVFGKFMLGSAFYSDKLRAAAPPSVSSDNPSSLPSS